MSTITHHIPVTTGQAHHMTLRLHLSYGAPAPIADYAIYGSILQDGETVPISAAVSDTSDIQLTIPPLTPGIHPYTLHIHNKSIGADHLLLQGNCNVSELIDGYASDTENRERITATLNADLSDITVTMQIGEANNASPQPDMEAILTDPEFLQRLKEACGILDMEKTLAAKANQSDMDAALVKKADITTLEAGLASKPDTATMTEALAMKANKTDIETGLASKADTSTLTNYIPYAKIGRALSKGSDGSINVDLSHYTGDVALTGQNIAIMGSTSVLIGQTATNKLIINNDTSQLLHNKRSEIMCGDSVVRVGIHAFHLQNGPEYNDCVITAFNYGTLALQAKQEIAMRSISGNHPGVFIRGSFNNQDFHDVLFVYNSTSSYDQIARYRVYGNQINHYTTFYSGHN